MDELNIYIEQVITGERVRKDFGNIDELCDSIKAVGLIQPIVLNRDFRLIAGERRLRALQRIGVKVLYHASHFIWKDELDELGGGLSRLRGYREPARRRFDLGKNVRIVEQMNHLI